ncbi:hypothetical protein B0H11DRAFT_2040347 [Mycena galericulata]|nr:hypothetical protein B0H11DRAFT_2040347 [Mycena galericulata]
MDGTRSALASSSSSSTNAYDSSPATNSHIGRHHIRGTDSSSRRSQSPSAASADSFEDWMNEHTTPLTPTRTRGPGSKSKARTSGEPKPRGATRAKSGCYTCRIRRKKCDERPNLDGACETCVRLRIQCLGFGAQRPEWLREKRQVSETRDKIKGFLGAQGRIRGRPGPAAGSGSRDSDQTLPVLQLDTEDHSSAVRETSRLTLPTPNITPVITEGYDLPAVEYSSFFTRHTEYSAPPPTEYPY